MSKVDRTQAKSLELALVGAGGEPVDLRRTFLSHGVASLPPQSIDEDAVTLETTLRLPRARPRTVIVSSGGSGSARIDVRGRAPGAAAAEAILAGVERVLRLDEDLSEFYDLAAEDPALEWVPAAGAGRMIRSPTVFEEVVKTVCTTNCTWSATERMVAALVEHLGEPAPGAGPGPLGRAFPTPEAMASAGERFYKDVVRAGYRGPYFIELARLVRDGEVDLEILGRAPADEIPDDEVEARLLALPGVGPYAAAHVMMMIGRYSRLILDSWTRPKYARLVGRKSAKDSTIERRFRRYKDYAGLAFWMFLTRDWVEDPLPA
jgi:3-methyladenine DNA glycosylase/8-oxoguanine DNA glycosylase